VAGFTFAILAKALRAARGFAVLVQKGHHGLFVEPTASFACPLVQLSTPLPSHRNKKAHLTFVRQAFYFSNW